MPEPTWTRAPPTNVWAGSAHDVAVGQSAHTVGWVKKVTRHAALASLASLAALIIHQVAYLVAFPVMAARGDQLADHGHLAAQWALVTPVAVLAAAGYVIVQVRKLGFASHLRWQPLGAVAAALFVAQEAIELWVQGGDITTVIEHPAVLVGLVVTPFVAALVVRAIDETTEFVSRLLKPTPADTPVSTTIPFWSDLPRPHHLWLGASSPRGPPRPIRI